MSIVGIISSPPARIEDRLHFTLRRDDSGQKLQCATELDFGQFPSIKEGDHVVLTGMMEEGQADGQAGSFIADSLNPFQRPGRRLASVP